MSPFVPLQENVLPWHVQSTPNMIDPHELEVDVPEGPDWDLANDVNDLFI